LAIGNGKTTAMKAIDTKLTKNPLNVKKTYTLIRTLLKAKSDCNKLAASVLLTPTISIGRKATGHE
jgi:hypothetical protein